MIGKREMTPFIGPYHAQRVHLKSGSPAAEDRGSMIRRNGHGKGVNCYSITPDHKLSGPERGLYRVTHHG